MVRQGLRLLEEAEHRRLLEEWIFEGLTEEEQDRIPSDLLGRARAHFRQLVDDALREVAEDRVVDGPTAMQRLKERIEAQVGTSQATSSEGDPGVNRYDAYDPFARVYNPALGFLRDEGLPDPRTSGSGESSPWMRRPGSLLRYRTASAWFDLHMMRTRRSEGWM